MAAVVACPVCDGEHHGPALGVVGERTPPEVFRMFCPADSEWFEVEAVKEGEEPGDKEERE